jgi:thioredoxin 1
LKSDLIVITNFWAEWNGPSRALKPVLEEVARIYGGQVKVVTFDIDANPATTAAYGVLQVPTLIFFKNGLPIEKLVGSITKEQIIQKFDRYLIKE